MKKRVMALALTMSLLWTVIGNAVYAAPVEETEPATETVVEELTEAVADVEEIDESEEVVEDVEETEASEEFTEETSKTSGTCGENLTWELSDDGVLTISGTGEMEFEPVEEDWAPAPWDDYLLKNVRKVVIEEGVTSIAANAFSSGMEITEVVIPDTVTSIGESVFEYCESLKEISLPNGLTEIADYLFAGCMNLEKIEIPESVTRIGNEAFCDCTSLSVTIPANVEIIGNFAFSSTSINEVVLSDEVKELGEYAFADTLLEKIVFPNTMKEIPEGIVCNCLKLTSISIPEDVTKIGDFAFSGTAITSFEIPKGVTVIEYGLFNECGKLTEVTIPKSVISIEAWAFARTAFTSFEVPEGITSIEYGTFDGCEKLTEVTIPESVTSIKSDAFARTALKTIVLPKSVEEIEEHALGYSYFYEYDDENGYGPVTYTPVNGFEITGYLNTSAEKYAKENDFQFNFLDIIIVDEKTDEVYVINSGENLQIYCTGEFEDFISVEMDGVLVDPSNYTVREGSTIVTFTSAYLETLSPGKHTVTLNFVNDSVSTVISILTKQEAASQGSAGSGTTTGSGTSTGIFSGIMNPKTGDNANMAMWLVLAVVAVMIGSAAVIRKNKRL